MITIGQHDLTDETDKLNKFNHVDNNNGQHDLTDETYKLDKFNHDDNKGQHDVNG